MANEAAIKALENAYQIEADAIRHALGGIKHEDFLRAVSVLANAPRIAASGCATPASAASTLRISCAALSGPRALSRPPRPYTARVVFYKKTT